MSARVNRSLIVLLLATIEASTAATTAQAGDDSYYYELSCGQLWYERNKIFAAAGHCFTTQRAIRVFGRGCFAPFGKLHIGQRSTVNNIKRAERAKGC